MTNKSNLRRMSTEIRDSLVKSRSLLGKISVVSTPLDKIAELLEGANFIDPWFPPKERSITGKIEKFDRKVEWRRPKEFFNESYQLFQDEIEPNDILQGQLGDCWFMCAISAIAERPQLVQRLFQAEGTNDQGIYNIRLCISGEWRWVTVDDYFPCYKSGQPMFSRCHGNELWVLLLQKAYAKIHGSYLQLRSGWVNDAMLDLTGCPTMKFKFDKPKVKQQLRDGTLWKKLRKYADEGSLISASTPGRDEWSETKKRKPNKTIGLVPGHAYTVIRVELVHGNKLLCIRNPWGEFEWNGDWSDHSPLWTEEMKTALEPILDENDGTFWMKYKDFVKYF